MTAISVLDYAIRIAGAGALILGLALWGGVLPDLVHLHVALGVAVVASLFVMACLALRRGAPAALAVAALVWGAVTLAVGLGQRQMLAGDWHWVVQAVHLALGIGAIALGAVLARSARRAGAVNEAAR